MNFEYSDEQRLLSETLRKFLNTGYGFDARAKITATPAGFSEDVWAALAGGCAALLVVSARRADGDAGGISLVLVERGAAGLAIDDARTLDNLRVADGRLSGVRVGRDALLGAEGGGLPLIEEVVDYTTALVCAEAVGAIKYAHDATLDYLKTRRQFGVPIGSFQALQHRMVDVLIAYEQARSIATLACVKVDTADAAERRRVVSAAKIKIADAARHVSQEAVQLHGGMGMTEELKISHTFRRLTTIAQAFGDADHHLARFGGARRGSLAHTIDAASRDARMRVRRPRRRAPARAGDRRAPAPRRCAAAPRRDPRGRSATAGAPSSPRRGGWRRRPGRPAARRRW